MARPAKITEPIAIRIAELRAKGLTGLAIVRMLKAEGRGVSVRTLSRHLAKLGETQAITPVADTPDPALSGAEREAGEALDSDDIGRLTQARNQISRAMGQWEWQLGANPTAVRAYAALARILADLTAKLVELRPRDDRELDHLSVLGGASRDELIAKAAAGARQDAGMRERLATLEKYLGELRP